MIRGKIPDEYNKYVPGGYSYTFPVRVVRRCRIRSTPSGRCLPSLRGLNRTGYESNGE